MSLSAAKVANHFLSLAEKEGKTLTTLKLVKIVYIAHGWCLAVLDRDILNGETVQAWKHGPVIPSLYHEFKSYGRQAITSRATDLKFITQDDDRNNFSFRVVTPTLDEGESDLVSVLDFVWDVYKQYSAFDLVNMTHRPDTPWSDCYKEKGENNVISNDKIKEFYTDQVSKLLEKTQQ